MSKCKVIYCTVGLEERVNEFLAKNPDIVVRGVALEQGVCVIVYDEMLTLTVEGSSI